MEGKKRQQTYGEERKGWREMKNAYGEDGGGIGTEMEGGDRKMER